jgi:deazaflavin-dependent oxidoreductase (nitroreductase family)
MPNLSTPDRPDTDRRRYRRYTRAAVHQARQLRPVTAAISYARSRLDPILYRATRGRLTLTGPSQPTMLLTTRNRTTGQPHTDPVSYQPDGDNLIAAYDNHDPATPDNWPANLHTDPHATIQIGTTTASYRARPATPAETDHATPRPPSLRPTRHTHPQPTRHAYTFEPLHGPPQRPTATGIQWLPPQNPEHTQNR